MKNEMTFTYQTRPVLDEEQEKILDKYACTLSMVERSLYAEISKGHSGPSCKKAFLEKFKITARQFNACRVSVEGKIEACKASQKLSLANLKRQIETIDGQIQRLKKKPSKHFALHQKKRRRNILSNRLASVEEDIKQNRVRLCFGGKKLFNAQFFYVETDRFGNPITKKVFSWVSYGKSTGELKAITGNLCKEVAEYAREVKKTIVIEKLDFQKKKGALRDENKKFARLLSSFSYGMFFSFLLSRAFKHGIQVHQVDPAFTSVIGRVNYAQRYGLSTHLAAALCIARRYQQFSESPCSPKGNIPDGKGGHVAFVLPVRNRAKHVWNFWGLVKKKITTVLAAHFQAMKNRSLSPLNPAFATGYS